MEYLGIKKLNRKYRQISAQSKEIKQKGGQPFQFHLYRILLSE